MAKSPEPLGKNYLREPKSWEDVENNPTYLDIEMMKQRTRDVCQYALPLLDGKEPDPYLPRLGMFCSHPGLGKTYTCQSEVKRVFKRTLPLHSPANVTSFARDMWLAREAGHPVYLMDDADLTARSEPMINLAKTAWDSTLHTVVPRLTEKILRNEKYRREHDDRYDRTIPPPQYDWRLGVLWPANKNFATETGRKLNAHDDFKALVDRGLDPIWVNSDPRNVCLYTIWMILRGDLFRNAGLSLAQQDETLRFFLEHAEHLPRPNLRLAVRLAASRRTPNYKLRWDHFIRSEHEDTQGEPRKLRKDDLKVPTVREDLQHRQNEVLPRPNKASVPALQPTASRPDVPSSKVDGPEVDRPRLVATAASEQSEATVAPKVAPESTTDAATEPSVPPTEPHWVTVPPDPVPTPQPNKRRQTKFAPALGNELSADPEPLVASDSKKKSTTRK
jgi:hypothetical protein